MTWRNGFLRVDRNVVSARFVEFHSVKIAGQRKREDQTRNASRSKFFRVSALVSICKKGEDLSVMKSGGSKYPFCMNPTGD